MLYLSIALLLLFWAISLQRVGSSERGVVYRLGRKLPTPHPPGIFFIIPFVDRVDRISIEPFAVSLPPQSAVTKDEIPIQLQASLDAKVINPDLAVIKVRDWRIHLMSQLQELMKDKLEELDFDNLDAVFTDWIFLIRTELDREAAQIGVEITGLQISNLSPRSRPSG